MLVNNLNILRGRDLLPLNGDKSLLKYRIIGCIIEV